MEFLLPVGENDSAFLNKIEPREWFENIAETTSEDLMSYCDFGASSFIFANTVWIRPWTLEIPSTTEVKAEVEISSASAESFGFR